MRIGVFLHGTTLMHRSALGQSREERVRQVQQSEASVHDYAAYVPVGNAAHKLRTWSEQGAEIVYLSSHRQPEHVEQDQAALETYHFPGGQVVFRGSGQTYQDLIESILPDVLIEDDCESIGGQHQMISPHLRPELQASITSIVVKEFEGIDHLPDDISTLKRTSMTEPIYFDGLSLPVSDVELSVAFYQQFGFEILVQHGNFALLRLGEGTIGLLKMDVSKWPSALRGAVHIELSTENLDALFEQLQAQGVHFASPPIDRSWERQMFTYDPDGYRLEIAQGRRG